MNLWKGIYWKLEATVSLSVEASGKDRDSFGFDLCVVSGVIPPPQSSLTLSPEKIQLLPLHACSRANMLVIAVFSLQK